LGTCTCDSGYGPDQSGSGNQCVRKCASDELPIGNSSCSPNLLSKSLGPDPVTDPGGTDPAPPSSTPTTCNPITLGTGNKFATEVDYVGGSTSALSLVRTYNSAPSNRAAYDLASGWSIGVKRAITLDSPTNPTIAVMVRPDGRALRFTLSGSTWTPDADISDRLTPLTRTAANTLTGWRYGVASDASVEEYTAAGLLLQVTTRTGLVQFFSSSDGAGGIQYATTGHVNGYRAPTCTRPSGFAMPTTAGVVVCVTDLQGRQLNFEYDSSGRISRFADPMGQITQYAFDANNNLASVTWPDGTLRTYLYENATYPNALTGITDENGTRFATYGYDSQGRAVTETHAGGADAATLTFGTNTTTITDAIGTARTYSFQTVLGVNKSTGSNQPGGSGCSAAASSQTYDANGNVASSTDFNGNVTTYTYDLTRNLGISRTEAYGTPLARTTSTQWHTVWRAPVKIAQPLKLTTWVYNGDSYGGGTVTCAPAGAFVPTPSGTGVLFIAVVCRKIEQATTDANGSQGLTPTVTGSPRTWNYTYDAYGQVLTADGPRTDVSDFTTYTLYSSNDPTPSKRGNPATVTNALGHVTQITSYNANGQPLTIIDPNGLTTTLTYDARGRLTTKNVGGETSTYQYDGIGQLTLLTLPNGASLGYTYDAAHRLTALTDGLGNTIRYTLDALGNRIQEDVKDPTNQLSRTRQRAFDALNRLYQDIGAQNQTTTYAYDANGNLTGILDPLNRLTANSYDALNRLVQLTDPNNGQTQFAYNGQNRTTQVTDPRNLVTRYTVDGLGNLTQQVSPDTGTTQLSVDAAGNQVSRTDAKGQTTTTQYDALNRPTLISYPDGRQERYTWDQSGTGGASNLGRLTLVEELQSTQLIASTQYGYDTQGRIASETRTEGALTLVTSYAWSNGDLIGLTYPSGKQLAYGRDSQGRINQITLTNKGVTKTVLNQVQYHPFGGVKSYVTGSGQTFIRSQDTDGRINAYSLGDGLWQIGYDAAGRIGYQTDAGNAANTVSYSYDTLDRLTGTVLPTTSLGYGYDATGNRTSQTVGGSTYSYAVSPTSNQLTGINTAPPKSYTYDANGSVTGDGQNTFGYDARGRMTQAVTAAGTTQYRLDALGRRVAKTNTAEDTRFVYDRAGHLIAETDATGKAKREYIWLGDLPVGVLQ
jgi:YD repeat-containing protein